MKKKTLGYVIAIDYANGDTYYYRGCYDNDWVWCTGIKHAYHFKTRFEATDYCKYSRGCPPYRVVRAFKWVKSDYKDLTRLNLIEKLDWYVRQNFCEKRYSRLLTRKDELRRAL